MQTYVSHKTVKAAQIADVTGQTLTFADGTAIEVPVDLFSRYTPVSGDYLVEYADGYRSISPRKAFEEGYTHMHGPQDAPGMNFSAALGMIKAGKRVARAGWNGKDMFLFLVPGSVFKVNRPPLLGIYAEGTEIRYHGHIDMKTAQGYVVPWLASQSDLLAEDWMVLPDDGGMIPEGSAPNLTAEAVKNGAPDDGRAAA